MSIEATTLKQIILKQQYQIDDLENDIAFLREQAAQPKWRPIDENTPKNKDVLLLIRDGNAMPIIVAKFIPQFTEESSEDFAEYDEKTDNYYCPEGWYEQQWFNDDFAYIGGDKVDAVAWMPLPSREREND